MGNLPYRLNSGLDRRRSGGVILLYHRVVAGVPDPQLLTVTSAHLAEHLQILAQACTPVSLRDLPSLRRPHPRRAAVAVTFDDGYADNLWEAKPLLERWQVPATMFVATGQLGRSEFWWDQVARVLLDTPALPPVLTLRVGGVERTWNVSDAAEAYRGWNVLQTWPGERGEAYKDLCGMLGGLEREERERVLDRLAEWGGAERKARVDYRVMTPDEVMALSEGDVVEVGGHTVTHARLSSLSRRVQFREIREGKTRLEHILGRPITSFSYPFGAPADFTLASMTLARIAGFRLACANYPGRVHRFSPTFALPRFIVRDWPGDEFERRLRAWLYA